MDSSPEEELEHRSAQGRPCHITLPSTVLSTIQHPHSHLLLSKKFEAQKQTTSPPPPVPPRRHTLAEICRYADEQCEYIEWMTRELEAEEALRRHSVPSTPPGTITNPFHGHADMWWRPTSAEDMYGTSALRRKHEEAIKKHPYSITKEPPELLERSGLQRLEMTWRSQAQYSSNESKVANLSQPMEVYAEYVHDHEAMLEQPSNEVLTGFKVTSSLREPVHNTWLERIATVMLEQSTNRKPEYAFPKFEVSSMLLKIPKFLVSLFWSPLELVVELMNEESSDDVEEC